MKTFNCYKRPYDLSYVVLIIKGYAGKTTGCTSSDTRGKGKLIQKLLLNQKCMGYLVRAYYSIYSTNYYKDESCGNADVKSKTTEDIISNRSFMEVLVLNHYVRVKNVLFWVVVVSVGGWRLVVTMVVSGGRWDYGWSQSKNRIGWTKTGPDRKLIWSKTPNGGPDQNVRFMSGSVRFFGLSARGLLCSAIGGVGGFQRWWVGLVVESLFGSGGGGKGWLWQ
nr:hypothetical protein [Tanacetum cinerariifolium]